MIITADAGHLAAARHRHTQAGTPKPPARLTSERNDMTEPAAPPVRTARLTGACGAPGCPHLIWPGQPIVKPGPGSAWRHLRCDRPGRRAFPAAEHRPIAPKGRRR